MKVLSCVRVGSWKEGESVYKARYASPVGMRNVVFSFSDKVDCGDLLEAARIACEYDQENLWDEPQELWYSETPS